MDNSAFRRLVDQTPRNAQDGSPANITRLGGASTSLGSRQRSAIPMTPRTVKGGTNPDFARQLAERNSNGDQKKKKFKTSNPKGAKLAEGYQDRALARNAAEKDDVEPGDDRGARIEALEEQVKLGQMERATFEKLRDQITGGDISATHLVKGLDRQLLARVRRGEDVMNGQAENQASEGTADKVEVDEDAELEKIEQQEIAPIARQEVVKKGEMAPPPLAAGMKRSRNDILAELKASRRAAAEAKLTAQPQLGSRFRKLGESRVSSRIERDEKGRDVLITVDEEGRVKRKVRKVPKDKSVPAASPPPSKSLKALDAGVVIPDLPSAGSVEVEKDNDDIFADAGTEYDPLGEVQDDATSSEDDDNAQPQPQSSELDVKPAQTAENLTEGPSAVADSANQNPTAQSRKHNYFGETLTEPTPSDDKPVPFSDPTILATIKRAAKLREKEEQDAQAQGSEESSAAKRLLGRRDRDLDDIDMGFGSSRNDDEEGGEDDRSMKLSQWRGLEGTDDHDDGDGNQARGGQSQRKRGKKKRKGDKHSAGDVLKIIEGRQK